jgi:bifunctional non-homologous end joining protein LigD
MTMGVVRDKNKHKTTTAAHSATQPMRMQSQTKATAKNERSRSVRSANDKLKDYIKPMLAHIHDQPFDDIDWIFEVKWDGYRAIAEINQEEIRLYSRNGLSFLRLYPEVAEELKKIKEDVILDGEIVVLNQNNKPDFQKLQQYDNHPSLPILYYVFDCLSHNGKSLTHLPLLERKKIAEKVLVKSKILRYSDHVLQSGIEFFSKIIEMDMEGMIAKRAASPYLPAKRTRDWLKIKNHNTQEAIIAGYTAPRGSREFFGALILGIYMGKKLKYIGHTGTGFTSATLKEVYDMLKPLKRDNSPFDKKVVVNSPVTWVDPVLVCAIKFTEITQEGILRHPVFLGLRIDKSAEETNTLDAKARTTTTKTKTQKPKAGSPSRKKKKDKQKRMVGSHEVLLTNQEKLYWPDEKITKGDLIEYYDKVSRYILPYLKNRPQSLRRNPNGIKDRGFFHKDAGHDAPDWVDTASLPADGAKKKIEYILCNNKATLLYLNNLGCIELNPWNSRIGKLDNPDYMVIDLDPSDNNTFEQIIDTARVVKEILDKAGANAYCKTSGATGLHVFVPLKAQYGYDEIRDFAEIIALRTQEILPATTTVERSLNKRNGRIYLDYLQNKKGQTVASVYSVRPKPGATVSTPLLWKEVKPGLTPSMFTMHNLVKRLQKKGDLFQGVLKEAINLKKCLKNLGA